MKILEGGYKKCSKCKRILEIGKFFVRGKYKDGNTRLYSSCRSCMGIVRKRYSDKIKLEDPARYKKWVKKSNLAVPDFRRWAGSSIGGHKYSGYAVNISIKELTDLASRTPECLVCGTKLCYSKGRGRPYPDSPTLDNLDCSKTLTLSNTVIMCHLCNTSKNRRTLLEFLDYCTLVSSKRSEILSKAGHTEFH